jgi:hypothetical protein
MPTRTRWYDLSASTLLTAGAFCSSSPSSALALASDDCQPFQTTNNTPRVEEFIAAPMAFE